MNWVTYYPIVTILNVIVSVLVDSDVPCLCISILVLMILLLIDSK